jgi:hypothetical protein
MNSSDQTTDTTQKSRTYAFKFLTPITSSEENTENLHGFKQVYKPRNINVLVWIITARQLVSPGSTVKGFTECCISSTMDGTDGDMLWNGSEEGGNARSESQEDEDTVKMETLPDTDL